MASLVVIIELAILLALSRRIHQAIGSLLMWLTNDKQVSAYIFAIFFLPGTFVHETAHFLTALVLLVPVHQPEFFPEITDDKTIKLGSVQTAKSDPIRQFLIGI